MGYHGVVTEKRRKPRPAKDKFPPKLNTHHDTSHDDTTLRHIYDTSIPCFMQAESGGIFRQAVVRVGIGKADAMLIFKLNDTAFFKLYYSIFRGV